jgi:hypothetical protein
MKFVRSLQALAIVVTFLSAPAVALAHPAQATSAGAGQTDTTRKVKDNKPNKANKGSKHRKRKGGRKGKRKADNGATTPATTR